MKKKEWLNPNHMKIETGCKAFDKQCTCISTGNQIGNCVLSTYVRPSTETECNGYHNEKGHLQNYDLSWMGMTLPERVRTFIKEYDKKCILFQFHHRNNGKKIIDGWIVTDEKHGLLKLFYGYSNKRYAIMETVKQYVCE